MEVFSQVYNQVLATRDDYMYKNYIAINKLWEAENCNLISENIKPNTDFLDIGAHIGLISLSIRKSLSGTGRIHCFECDNTNFNFLRFNTSHYNNISLYNFGLSDKQNIGSMSVNTYNHGCNHISSTMDETFEYEHNKGAILTKCNHIFFSLLPLDFLKDTFTNKISVIKVDIEGFEYHFLKGAKNVIQQHKPVIVIEIFERNKLKVDELLKEYGYTGKYICKEDYIYYPNGYRLLETAHEGS
jgi:FkbM family methyltransferase